ncbi:MAG: hypothetical protein U0W24_04685 [Bacteroidales bacterium]
MFLRIEAFIWNLIRKTPSNKKLYRLFEKVDKIVIKEDGVTKNRALSKKVVLVIEDLTKIKRFQNLLEIIEPGIGGACCCSGDFALELQAKGKICATLGLHYGESIRYEYWNSDAQLAKNMELLEFLHQEGLPEPLMLFKGEIHNINN